MDVLFFLKNRTAFIHQLYSTASTPYIERLRKIEVGEEPFEPWREPYEDESPFLSEYCESLQSLDTLRYMCVSILASALQSYLDEWVKQSIPVDPELKNTIFKKRGWLHGYNAHFKSHFKIDFDTASVNLELIEEIILARNIIQHPSSIASDVTYYNDDALEKLSSPLFVDKSDIYFSLNSDSTIFKPSLHITEEMLLAAISEVECFAEWFCNEIDPEGYKCSMGRKQVPKSGVGHEP